jgi:hypothetical protein
MMKISIDCLCDVTFYKCRNIFRECKVFFQGHELLFFKFAVSKWLSIKSLNVKKTLKISGIVVVIVLLFLIVLPFAFKGKIEKIIKKQASNSLNAKLSFNSLSVSLFRDFPNLSASLNDFTLIGIDSFATDTLVRAESIRLSIDLRQLIADNGYKIRKVVVADGDVKIRVLPSGLANWDIMKSDSLTSDAAQDTSALRLDMEKVILDDVNIIYNDRLHDLLAECMHTKAELNGALSSAFTTIVSELQIGSLTYSQFGFPILSGVALQADLNLDADLNNYVFTFKSNKILLNDLELSFDGSVGLPGDDISLDIKALTKQITFKQFLSVLPSFYTSDFKDVVAAGKFKLDFFMKGLMTSDLWPSFGIKLLVDGGSFQYPSLPKSVKDIQIALQIANPGGTLDATVVDLSKFHFNLGGNPFDLKAMITTPESDAGFDIGLRGKLNFGMLKEVYPLPEDVRLQGQFDADIAAKGKMSYVEKKMYDKFVLKGKLGVKNIKLKTAALPEVAVQTADLIVTSKTADLTSLSMLIGKNDLRASGRLSNFLGWFLRDDVLEGVLFIQSNYLNLNDFMSSDTVSTAKSTLMSAFEIPQNLDLKLLANGGHIVFSKLDLTNAKASMTVNEGRLTIKDLSANALGGSLATSGFYETINPEKPKIAFGLNLKAVSYAQTLTSFEFVQKIAPIFSNVKGDYSMKLDLNTELDNQLNPNLSVLSGMGSIQSANIKVMGVKVFEVLGNVLHKDNLKNPTIKDLSTTFTIKDGKVTTKPFDIQIAEIGLTLGGVTGLDKTINYDLGVALPQHLSVAGISNLQGKITGTFDKPAISINTASAAKKAAETIANKVLVKTLGSNVEESKQRVEQELNRKAELMRAEAKAGGDKLIAEADKQGNLLIEKASNPILKAAAKSAAAKLKSEAQKKAAALIAETETEIKKMVANAQARAL